MENSNRSSKRNRHTGGKVTAGAVILALLLAGGHFGLGIGRGGGGLLTGEAMESAKESASQAVENTKEAVTETDRKTEEKTGETAQEKVEEGTAPQDDGVLTITVQEDKLLYEGQETDMTQLEESLLRDYKGETTTVELRDDHAIKAAYDEVTALLQKLSIPFTTGK